MGCEAVSIPTFAPRSSFEPEFALVRRSHPKKREHDVKQEVQKVSPVLRKISLVPEKHPYKRF